MVHGMRVMARLGKLYWGICLSLEIKMHAELCLVGKGKVTVEFHFSESGC